MPAVDKCRKCRYILNEGWIGEMREKGLNRMAPLRNIIIIGASSGIGRELALALGQDAAVKLGLLARRELALAELATQLPARCLCRKLDLAAAERGTQFEAFLREFGTVDAIIYCAGFGEINPELAWPLCRETLEVNVTGFTEIVNLAYRVLAAQGGGLLAAISSVGGLRGMENDSGYSASKSYMLRYLEGLARKARKEAVPIHVATILPGFVDTKMAKGDTFFWMCSPAVAAGQILAGLRKRKRYIYVTRRWRLVAGILRLLPGGIYERL